MFLTSSLVVHYSLTMTLRLLFESKVLILLGLVSLTVGHYRDICSIGIQKWNRAVNSNWTYQGIDPANNNKEYWERDRSSTRSIQWGEKYGLGQRYWLLYDVNPTEFYGYCKLPNTDPWDCDRNWWIWDNKRNDYIHYPWFRVNYCNQFTLNTDCTDPAWLS